ncbi:MAG TPA: hypothetical protein VGG64_03520 [Pirellulales bacterium]
MRLLAAQAIAANALQYAPVPAAQGRLPWHTRKGEQTRDGLVARMVWTKDPPQNHTERDQRRRKHAIAKLHALLDHLRLAGYEVIDA